MTDRIKLLLEQLSLSPSEFADRIGVQRSSVSHVLSGRNKPSIDFLEKILNVFPGIDTTWLITGKAGTNTPDRNADDTSNPEPKVQKSFFLDDQHEKPPAPAVEEPVDHIIIVYKNNTFRLLKPSED
jgi:transcriptional regulator with XRE-family HTH domain